ncbi:MAG: hypothetical protein WD851_13530 [Pirellulales bacterium]
MELSLKRSFWATVDMTFAIGFVCSLLVIVPVGALLFALDKASPQYKFWWSCVVLTMAAICFVTCVYVLSWPYYSETTRQTMNPGGPSGSVLLGIMFWVLGATVVIPSFPALLLLGLFPPKSFSQRKRLVLAVVVVAFVIAAAALTLVKQRAYMDDFRTEKLSQSKVHLNASNI